MIGAGLAGAAVAASLARRGWLVTVLDAADAPACGASGLPGGLLAPLVSKDDNLASRLSRCGVRSTLQQAQALLQIDQDWQPSGVQEWQANPHWVRLTLHPTAGPVPQYLTLTGNGREVELGAFLTEAERIALHTDLTQALARTRTRG